MEDEKYTSNPPSSQSGNEGNAIRGQVDARTKIEKVNDETQRLHTSVRVSGDLADVIRQTASGSTEVTLNRSKTTPTEDQALWVTIRNRTRAVGFDKYYQYIQEVLCTNGPTGQASENQVLRQTVQEDRDDLLSRNTLHGVDVYKLLKLATEAFLIIECGLIGPKGQFFDGPTMEFDEVTESRRLGYATTEDEVRDKLDVYLSANSSGVAMLPYLDRIVTQIIGLDPDARAERLPYCEAVLSNRLSSPSMIELIWSYWQEQGALVQTMNLISLRFQNRRLRERDPLANLELDPLRPLNHLLWGFIQDESNRLSLQRRAYEYDHHYGLILMGKAIPHLRSADSRSMFLEAFHNLLMRTALFYREDDDTTVLADAFPLLNALREVHIILSEGAHNQFGDLPWTARVEMLIMQWLLARPEIKAFLRGRYMVPYQEPWMGAVDDMKRLQGWGNIPVTHFHELATHGEQILLSVRYGDWSSQNDQEMARNWARYWRPEIQRYIHAYNAVTGVDLSTEVADVRLAENRYLQPAILLGNRPNWRHSRNRALPGRSGLRQLPPATSRRGASLEFDYSRHALITRGGE